MDRATGFEPVGCRFESCRARQKNRDVTQRVMSLFFWPGQAGREGSIRAFNKAKFPRIGGNENNRGCGWPTGGRKYIPARAIARAGKIKQAQRRRVLLGAASNAPKNRLGPLLPGTAEETAREFFAMYLYRTRCEYFYRNEIPYEKLTTRLLRKNVV